MSRKVFSICPDFKEFYKSVHIQPEKKMQLAILERSILDYVIADDEESYNYGTKNNCRRAAHQWFYSQDEEYFLSFGYICFMFDFCKEKILESVEKARREINENKMKGFREYRLLDKRN
jgi:hypothetical protein